MSQIPNYPSQQSWPYGQGVIGVPQAKTSGLAIASLVCGCVGTVACCSFVPSILGVVFGAVALGPIRSGALRGRGLALSGIITGAIGLLAGVVVWVIAAGSPPNKPLAAHEVSASYIRELQSLGALEPNEDIELLYAGGMFSVRESGVLITGARLVVYGEGQQIHASPLSAIRAIELSPGESWFDDGRFVVETDAGDLMVFSVTSWEEGDKLFERILRQRAAKARDAAGKPAPTDQVSTPEDEN